MTAFYSPSAQGKERNSSFEGVFPSLKAAIWKKQLFGARKVVFFQKEPPPKKQQLFGAWKVVFFFRRAVGDFFWAFRADTASSESGGE